MGGLHLRLQSKESAEVVLIEEGNPTKIDSSDFLGNWGISGMLIFTTALPERPSR
jgi:hypothetical protein